ncbi:hypothetical protein SERLADRAFT_374487 [Serpula lacrymans var. lacrymans S7.9]|uniref:Uncharacterized protein n=1 Tax=Serpula lacrymans var. lacrymans (strain S7.9) TaxID=578457 RepID=F8PC01_SERL9|nr:uncharacterized protein SERLADRAFT_374487 [Serpula lacrymans var. lacrymans S7.9]EGO19204.1 hypothetical protein SERLADRAFT_374487 [Serpula lacrymans var. lacrymans S7.9]
MTENLFRAFKGPSTCLSIEWDIIPARRFREKVALKLESEYPLNVSWRRLIGSARRKVNGKSLESALRRDMSVNMSP